MKHLFYFYSCFNGTFLGELLDEAVELNKDKNNEVLFVYCGGVNEMCIQNSEGSRLLCRFCLANTKRIIKQFGINCLPLITFAHNKETYQKFIYNNAEDIKNTQYRDVNIGLGIMSSYITRTRNLNPIINESSRSFFDAHLRQNEVFVDALYNAIEYFKPDTIHSFNGRFEETRPIFDLCQAMGIKCYLYEGTRKDNSWKKVIFEDHLPHDIKYWCKRRDYSWDHYPLSNEEKIELGKSFFIRRRNGEYAGDKIYIKDQVAGKIPKIDKSKINIGIMNSSEDEYAAVGAEWESLKFFPSQYDGIIFLLEHTDESVHFYLRIHPNLKDIQYKYHLNLLQLEKHYKNITVIPGNSEVSTYSLLDNMDKIIVFGSTMGIESVFWGKPTINLGPALYSYDDICYVPKNNDELLSMLIAPLAPRFNENVYHYGAYSMNEEPMFISDKSVDYQTTNHRLLGFRYQVFNFENFFISTKATALYLAIGRYLTSRKFFNKYKLPVLEK